MGTHRITFVDDDTAAPEVPEGKTLSEDLDITKSPILFGCRTGICGTCLVEIVEGADQLPPPDEDELEILELYAEGLKNARLACQIDVRADLVLRAHCEDRWEGV